MIEKHYGAMFGAIPTTSLNAFLEQKPKPFPKPRATAPTINRVEYFEGVEIEGEFERENWSGRVDLNHRLHGPEPCALPS